MRPTFRRLLAVSTAAVALMGTPQAFAADTYTTDRVTVPIMANSSDLDQLRADTTARLRPLCPDMPEHELAELVDEIVAVRSKYEERQRDVLFGTGEHAGRGASEPARPSEFS